MSNFEGYNRKKKKWYANPLVLALIGLVFLGFVCTDARDQALSAINSATEREEEESDSGGEEQGEEEDGEVVVSTATAVPLLFVRLTLEELETEFEEDGVAATEKYFTQRILLDLMVSRMITGPLGDVIALVSSTKNPAASLSVSFRPEEDSKVSELDSGSLITIVCNARESILGGPSLYNCMIVGAR